MPGSASGAYIAKPADHFDPSKPLPVDMSDQARAEFNAYIAKNRVAKGLAAAAPPAPAPAVSKGWPSLMDAIGLIRTGMPTLGGLL